MHVRMMLVLASSVTTLAAPALALSPAGASKTNARAASSEPSESARGLATGGCSWKSGPSQHAATACCPHGGEPSAAALTPEQERIEAGWARYVQVRAHVI